MVVGVIWEMAGLFGAIPLGLPFQDAVERVRREREWVSE